MRRRKIRYAVVGLGHIDQVAVLPAFAHASANSELAAVVSGDAAKRRSIGRRYGVPAYDYDAYEACLDDGIDAVYIGLPNHQHAAYAIRAARAGVHVLCEKPMAVTSRDCRRMLQAAKRNRVRLMIAYRLHFDAATLEAQRIARSGRLGELRFFHSAFSMQVKRGDIRVQRATGGGTLYDLGVYCIQAARMLFRANPIEVQAASASRADDARFREVDEMTSAVLRFPDERLAVFTSSFGASDVSSYRLIGTRGDLHVEPAYEYREGLAHTLRIGNRTVRRRFPKSDQFAPELLHFSECILRNRDPEPSGAEGKVDVQIIEALLRSARSGRVVRLNLDTRGDRWPTRRQVRRLPPVRKPRLVGTESASR
jgi:glucose-fructose oxidoreductase